MTNEKTYDFRRFNAIYRRYCRQERLPMVSQAELKELWALTVNNDSFDEPQWN